MDHSYESGGERLCHKRIGGYGCIPEAGYCIAAEPNQVWKSGELELLKRSGQKCLCHRRDTSARWYEIAVIVVQFVEAVYFDQPQNAQVRYKAASTMGSLVLLCVWPRSTG